MLYCLIFTVSVIIIDQISKIMAANFLADGEAFELIPGIIHFTYVENRGAAFGMLSEHRWIFMLLSTIAIVLIIIFLIKERPQNIIVRTCIALILGGGIGNMIDRIFRGYVIDFIDAHFIDFYVFNIADSAVCVGCVLLIIYMIFTELLTAKNKNNNDEPSGGSFEISKK